MAAVAVSEPMSAKERAFVWRCYDDVPDPKGPPYAECDLERGHGGPHWEAPRTPSRLELLLERLDGWRNDANAYETADEMVDVARRELRRGLGMEDTDATNG